MKKLNVKETSIQEITDHWGFKPVFPFSSSGLLYVRCNKKAEVNWNSAPVFNYQELIKRGDFEIKV